MKAITNKVKRVDSKNCTFSEMEAGNKSRKVANRREAKRDIQTLLDEDESIAQEQDDFYSTEREEDLFEEEEFLANEFHTEGYDRRYAPVQYFFEQDKDADGHHFYEPCPCCGI
jgi:hypothetical protein